MIVATDGSYTSRTRALGWAWVAQDGQWEADGMFLHSGSSSRAELAALLSALEAFSDEPDLTIGTDSASTIRIFRSTMWDHLASGWMDPRGFPVQDADLIDAIIDAVTARALADLPPAKVQKVSAHSGDPLNEWADYLARLGASTRIASGSASGAGLVDVSELPNAPRYDHTSTWSTLRRLSRECGMTFSQMRDTLESFGMIEQGNPSDAALRAGIAKLEHGRKRDTILWKRSVVSSLIESVKQSS